MTGVTLKLNHTVTADQLQAFDETILASGIVPRVPPIDGIDHPKVLSYLDVLRDKAPVGNKVAIIGCGGIGFDTAMYLSQPGESTSQNIAGFCNEWGIDSSLQQAGGLSPQGMQIPVAHGNCDAPAQSQQTRTRVRQNHRLDPSHHPALTRRENDPRRKLPEDRR